MCSLLRCTHFYTTTCRAQTATEAYSDDETRFQCIHTCVGILASVWKQTWSEYHHTYHQLGIRNANEQQHIIQCMCEEKRCWSFAKHIIFNSSAMITSSSSPSLLPWSDAICLREKKTIETALHCSSRFRWNNMLHSSTISFYIFLCS